MESRRRSVLVVDDDAAHRYSLGRRLQIAGFSVLEAANGLEAFQLALDADAVILDVHLPDMTGFEVCRRLRETKSLIDVPIIHISAAYIASADLVHGLDCGADAYLTRPVDDDVIVANLHAVLRLRENLWRLSTELEAKRKAEEDARDLFMAVLGHELRNPLDAITMTGHLLARSAPSAEQNAKAASRISAATLRMKHMLDDIQHYARSRLGADVPLHREPLELGKLASAVIDEMRAANPNVRIELTASGPGNGSWDGSRLSRVLTNLLRNAIQHGDRQRPIRVTVIGTAEWREITVSNEGPAIPDAMRVQLFQPMVKRTDTAPAESNMGLGLFVCKEIVEAHGGLISVVSDSTGTTFKVKLPTLQ